MKKTIKLVLLLLILFTLSPCVSAENIAEITIKDVNISNNNVVIIPVEIKNNPGIMGFKFSLKYPKEKIEISNITDGAVTSQGNIIHNIENDYGEANIIWFANKEVKTDGVIFTVSIKPTYGFSKGDSTEIEVVYSQADTFNEKYEDVLLNCQNIKVSYQTSQINTNEETKIQDEINEEITDSQIINVVNNALKNSNKTTIKDADNNTLYDVNNTISVITGTKSTSFQSVDEMKYAYYSALKNEYSESVKNNIGLDKFKEIIDSVLDKYNVKNIYEVPEEKRDAFVKEVGNSIKDEDVLASDIPSDFSTKDLLEVYNRIYELDNTVVNINKSKTIYLLISLIIVLIISVIIVLQVNRRRKLRK